MNNAGKIVKTQAIDVIFGVLLSGLVCQLLAGVFQHIFGLNKANFITLFLAFFLPRMVWLVAKYHFSKRNSKLI